MESTEELQKLEITALRSIYAEDFIDCPPPTVWKVRALPSPLGFLSSRPATQGATRLPEFLIKIAHPDSVEVYLHLHTKSVFRVPFFAADGF